MCLLLESRRLVLAVWLAVLCFLGRTFAVSDILIGVVFSSGRNTNCSNGSPEVEAFNLAVSSINDDFVNYPEMKLRPLTVCADPSDDFDNIVKVNNLLSRNISILIGPMETSAVIATQPLCKTARVPQIAPLTSLETVLSDDDEPGYLLRMNPTEKLKSKVLADIVKYFHWQTMAVLGYQDREASRGQSSFRLLAYENEWNVVLASLFPPLSIPGKGIAPAMALYRLSAASTRLAIVFCPPWAVKPMMNEARSMDSINMKTWTWIFSDLGNSEDEILRDSPEVPSYMRGLIGIRPSVGKGSEYETFQREWKQVMPHNPITVSVGRVYDSVLVAAEGIKRTLRDGVTVPSYQTYFGFCNHSDEGPENVFGKQLAEHLKEVTIKGVMGVIQASNPDSSGASFFDVVNLRSTGQVKVGEWNYTSGLHMYDHEKPVWASGGTKTPSDIPNYLVNKTLIITAIEAPPFVIVKGGSSSNDTGTTLEGLSIDILEEIRQELGFNYKIYLAPDGKFGVRDKMTGEWNGVVREIKEERAQVSIAPMTISSDRQAVLDFTHPYMTFGLAFMMRVKEVKASYFRFLLPFDKFLWIAICALVMVMGFLVWTCSVLSPRGYYGRCAQARPSEKLKQEVLEQSDALSLNNSIWSSWKAYVRQGAEHPTSFSGRITVSVFWFAVMIINATYTANLAAHLTVSRMQTPIETISDLARQTLIEYGTLRDSHLQTFFRKTDVPSYLVMGQFMEQHNTWMPSYDAAINRTMDSDFAFISDRPILDFVSRQKEKCGKLKVIGGFGNTYGYGFAFKLRSPYTALFNMALFRLQKDFIISALTHKWTKVKAKCELIDYLEKEEQEGSTVQMISFESMLGVFILLGMSGLLGFLIMIIEWIYASAKDSGKGIKGRETCCQAFGARLVQTLKDLFCCNQKTQHKKMMSDASEPSVVDYEVSL